MISRREFLRGGLLGGTALALAACAPSVAPSVVPTLSASSPVAASATPSASAVAAPTPSPGPTLAAKIAGLIVVGFRGSTLTQAPWVATALREGGLGGVILFDRDQLTGALRNVRSPNQVTTLVRDLRAAGGDRRIIVSVDQEGGVVTRLSPAHGFPAVASQATIGRGTVAAARTWGAGIARTLASVGINLNFAPVVDLDVNPRSPAIGALGRSFSAQPAVVIEMASSEIEAHHARDIRTTLKHFPGIGSATTNTDFGVADVTKTWTTRELEPFRALIAAGTADLVMAGHVVNGQLDPDHPASLSKAVVTDLLRSQLGWDGIIVTDDLQAAAITRAFGRDEAILLALEAGDDLLLLANQQAHDPAVVDRVVAVVSRAVASGRLPEARIDEAWGRVQRLFAG